jgi:hypothetical protein
MVQTLTIASRNFITSQDLFIRRRDFAGVGFGQVRRMDAGSLGAMVSAKSGTATMKVSW